MRVRRCVGLFLALVMLWGAVSCGGSSGGGDRGGAVTFSKSYGGPGSDEARAAIPTADGGYVFVGGHGEEDDGAHDLWISKLDANGDVQWQRAIGGLSARGVFPRTVRQAGDGGYVVVGFTVRRPGGTGHDAWVAKLSATGLIEWERAIDGAALPPGFAFAPANYGRGDYSDDKGRDVWPAADGSVVVAAVSTANLIEPASGAVYVDVQAVLALKIDAQGNLLWRRHFTDGTPNDPTTLAPIVRATADGGAALAYTQDFGAGARLRIVRLASNGDTQWQFEDDAFDATDLKQTHDDADDDGDGVANDGFILTAASSNLGEHRVDVHDRSVVLKVDANGQQQWRRVFGASGSDHVTLLAVDQLCAAASAGFACDFAVAGLRAQGRSGRQRGWVVRLSRTGSNIVDRLFESPSFRPSPFGDDLNVFDGAREAARFDDVRGIDAGRAIAVAGGLDTVAHRVVLDKASLDTLAVSEPFRRPVDSEFVEPDLLAAPLRFASDTVILTSKFDGRIWPERFHRYASPTALAGSATLERTVTLPGTLGEDVAIGVAEVIPGSYIVAGYSNSFQETDRIGNHGWLLRVTAGRVDWQRRYDRENAGSLRAIASSGDGGVVVAGNYHGRNRLLKLLGNGDVLWQSQPLPSFLDVITPREVRALPDGGYVVVGNNESFTPPALTAVYRLDTAGIVLWAQAYDSVTADSIEPIDDDGDGVRDDGFVMSDSGNNGVVEIPVAQVLKLDADGDVVWARTYRVRASDSAGPFVTRIRQSPDGSYIAGTSEEGVIAPQSITEQPFGQNNVLILKLDRDGNVVWTRSYGAFLSESLYDLQVLRDGGLLLAGASNSLGEGSEAWLLRLGPDGLLAPGCNAFLGALPSSGVTVEAFAPEPQLPQSGPPEMLQPISVLDTTLRARAPETIVARQCFGNANPQEPAPPPPPQRFTLTVTEPGSETGVVTSTPAGLVCGSAASPPPCSASFNAGDVFLSVDPGSVSRFLRWEDCTEVLPPDSGGAARCRVGMDRDRSVRAVFGQPQDRFLLRITVVGDGTVRSGDEGIGCGSFFGGNQDCEQLYDRLIAGTNLPTSITLSVFTNLADFHGWGGDCAAQGTTSSFNLTMDSDKTCTATFAGQPSTFELAVTKSGNGSGVVTSAPAGISCGAACDASFGVGETVRLLAFEDAGSAFDGWSGCDRLVPPPSGSIPECQVDMNASRNVQAAFTRPEVGQFLLEFVVTGSDGIVESADRGIICTASGPDCQELYDPGTAVQLSFNLLRAAGSFLGWGGDCSSFGSTANPTLVMNGPKRCTATFSSPPTARLTVGKVGPPSALIRSTPAGIECGPTCAADFPLNQTVRLTAVLAAGQSFSGWTGCDRRPAGANPWPDCEVDMTGDRAVEVRVE